MYMYVMNPSKWGLICDAIRQNESDLEKIKKHFLFSLYARMSVYYAENPIEIEHAVPEI